MKRLVCAVLVTILLGSCVALADSIDLPEYIIPSKYNADYNGDGKTDAEDLVCLAKYLSGDGTAMESSKALDLLDLIKLMKELAKL